MNKNEDSRIVTETVNESGYSPDDIISGILGVVVALSGGSLTVPYTAIVDFLHSGVDLKISKAADSDEVVITLEKAPNRISELLKTLN